MRILALSFLVGFAAASPTPTWSHAVSVEKSHTLAKRASVSDKATLGYASLNGGTTGGLGGSVTTVSTLAQFTAAVSEKKKEPAIVFVQGTIEGSAKVRIGSNKTIIGLPGSGFTGVGLEFKKQSNLILRNIVSSCVEAANGDGLTIQESTNVWVDHCEFNSGADWKEKGKDFYDGLVDVVHGSDYVTISHTRFLNHYKASLVGHSDSNGAQDTGHLHITYANNHWKHINSRGPSIRFGTGHIYNSVYEDMQSAINTRMGAQVLVQGNVFKNVSHPITSDDSKETGYAVAVGNDLGTAADKAPAGTLTAESIPYKFTLLDIKEVEAQVPVDAGATLTFDPVPSTNGTSLPPMGHARAIRRS